MEIWYFSATLLTETHWASQHIFFSGLLLFQILVFTSGSAFIFCPQEPSEPECWGHCHSLGLLRISSAPAAPVPGLPDHLHSHCAGEPGHDPDHQVQLQTPHAHVLLSQPLILRGFLLLNSSYTQATRKLDCRRQNHLLHRMPHAVLLCLHICGDRDIPVGSDGMWSSCGHSQPSSLDVPEALFLVGVCIILLECSCSLIYTYFLSLLSFCGTKFINNFVCEHAAIVAVSWSDPYISQEIILVSATVNEASSLMIILTSCVCIFITVLRMPSTGGGGAPHKAFFSCAPHLTTVNIFRRTILFPYCVPNFRSSRLMVKVASVFYIVVIPMLDPVIYSLSNKDVKESVKKLLNIKLFCDKM